MFLIFVVGKSELTVAGSENVIRLFQSHITCTGTLFVFTSLFMKQNKT